MILSNLLTVWAAEVGGGSQQNCCSVRFVKEVQSAQCKLMSVQLVWIGGESSSNEIVIGIWSEFNALCVFHSTAVAR